MINCVIIEDENLAQKGLMKLISKCSCLKLVAVFDEVSEFENFLISKPNEVINLILLDIELPRRNGINFLKENDIKIPVIITTAYNQYAIEGYELDIVDYLLKPIDEERFLKAIYKAEQYIEYLNFTENEKENFCYVKSDKTLERVNFNDVIYVEAMRNYVIYHLINNKRIITYSSLKSIEAGLPAKQFVRIQKSFIVNTKRITKIEKGAVYINELEIKINREHKNEIIQKLLQATS